jgi:hypothetical protein
VILLILLLVVLIDDGAVCLPHEKDDNDRNIKISMIVFFIGFILRNLIFLLIHLILYQFHLNLH